MNLGAKSTNEDVRVLADERVRAEERAAAADLVRKFVYGTVPITLLWAVVFSLSVPSAALRTWVQAGIFCTLGLSGLALVRVGRVALAARGMTSLSWCAVAIMSYREGGVSSLAFPAFGAILLMCGVLWSSRAAFVMTALTALYGGLLVWLGHADRLPAPHNVVKLEGRWLACCLIFGTIATLQYLSAKHARESQARARSEDEQRRRAEQKALATLGALEESERRFRNIFDSAAVALFEVDLSAFASWRDEQRASGERRDLRVRFESDPELLDAVAGRIRILDANTAGLRLIDLADKRSLLGPLAARFRPDNRKDVAELAIALIESREAVQNELSIVTFAGKAKRVLVTGKGPDAPAGYERVVLSVVDVTEQRRLEARSRITQRLEAIGRLAGGVAHDFNNALLVIMSWTSLLRRPGRSDAERAEGLEAISKSASRAAELTRQLLSIGRRGVHAPRPTDVDNVVDDTVQAISRLLPADIELRVTHGCNRLAMVDEGQLQQVLLNLALNARDAMPQGGVLELSTRVAEPAETADLAPDTRYVAITVRDNGTGMDTATLERIFEPFFTTKGEARGTGLGLATAHAIVIESRGKISVESRPGAGTSFHVYLPVADETETHAPISTSEPPREGFGRTVLLVEDEALVRDVLVQGLRAAGYTVLQAGDGASALARARDHQASGQRIDLLCTDGILPGMATRQFIDGFLALYPQAPVLVCSGHVEEELLRRRIERGEWAFLAKPFTPEELLRKCGELLREAGRRAESARVSS